MDFDPQEFEATALSVHLMPARKKRNYHHYYLLRKKQHRNVKETAKYTHIRTTKQCK